GNRRPDHRSLFRRACSPQRVVPLPGEFWGLLYPMGRCTKNNHNGPSADATISRDRCTYAVGTKSKPAKPKVVGIDVGRRRTQKRKATIRSHVTRIAVRSYVAVALTPGEDEPAKPSIRPQTAFLLDETRDGGDSIANAQIGEHERLGSTHAPGVPLHHLEGGADMRGEIDLVDDQKVGTC